MEYIHGTDDFQLNKKSAVTLGKFDGIHTGHQKLIEIVRKKADEENLLAVLFTFDSLPLSICPQKYQHFISTSSERRRLCENFGIDVEIEYPFTEEFMNMEPEDFICRILIDKLHAKYVVVGTDYRLEKTGQVMQQCLWKQEKNLDLQLLLLKRKNIRIRKSAVHI